MSLKITGTTTMYCLLGFPAKHSSSPEIHNKAFDLLSLDSRYLAFEVPPEGLRDAVFGLKALGCMGFNLTMPHKKNIIPLLDELSEAARLSGSVNTVVIRDGRLTGHTTDGSGFLSAVQMAGYEPKGEIVTILGSGGAAESIIAALALHGASEIRVLKRKNKTFKAAEDYASLITLETDCSVSVLPMEDQKALEQSIRESSLLINATNVGMGEFEGSSLVPRSYLSPGLFVSDIIYHPAETKLLRDAKEMGCRVQNGLMMLKMQAAHAFRLWTGHEMPQEILCGEDSLKERSNP